MVERKELNALIDREHDLALKFVDGVVASSFTIRGWAITGWGALLGFAVQQNQVRFAYVAIGAISAFYVIDAYHGWLYAEAVRYVRSIERLIELRYKLLARGDDADLEQDLEIELRVFRPGMLSQLQHFHLRSIWSARPALVYRVFYPSLVLVAVAAAIFLRVAATSHDPPRSKLVHITSASVSWFAEPVSVLEIQAT
jgi:hypothetical protein